VYVWTRLNGGGRNCYTVPDQNIEHKHTNSDYITRARVPDAPQKTRRHSLVGLPKLRDACFVVCVTKNKEIPDPYYHKRNQDTIHQAPATIRMRTTVVRKPAPALSPVVTGLYSVG
jgi:hypothetical protein